MKKQLLTATIMLTGMFVLTPSIADAKSSMDSNLKLLWMNTDVAPLHTSARQGFGMNGKFYLQNKDTKQIEVWDETGKITDIPSGEGTNITFDDAGNIIVRIGTFNTNYVSTRNELRIIPADGSDVLHRGVSTFGDMSEVTYSTKRLAVSCIWVQHGILN